MSDASCEYCGLMKTRQDLDMHGTHMYCSVAAKRTAERIFAELENFHSLYYQDQMKNGMFIRFQDTKEWKRFQQKFLQDAEVGKK